MQLLQSIISLGMLALAAAHPASVDLDERTDVQTVHLTFHGGPASYTMAFKADGTKHKTNNGIAVNIIDANDYNAFSQCTFETAGEKTLVQSIDVTDGSQHVVVGPPQPIISVSCQGMCVATYGMCYGTNGQYVGPCCNGFCAATRCRPWNTGHS